MAISLADHLHSQGLRLTPQRLLIIKILQEAGEHLSPAEIYRKAKEAMPGMTEATVYRTLTFLTGQGLALAAHIGGGQLVYENAGHNHHHLICRACGKTQEIEHADLEKLYDRFQSSTGYKIDSIHVTFFGLCPKCSKEEEGGKAFYQD
jgi:Fur family transcriptional regulator, ferric uptake regulator